MPISPAALATTPTPTAELAESFADRILQLQRRHRRETGQKLSPDAALEILGNLSDESFAELMPTKRGGLEGVRKVLDRMFYSPRCNAAILETILRTGSAQCGLTFLSETDRHAIEAAIPDDDEWNAPVIEWSIEDDYAGSRGCAGLALRGWAR